MRYNVYNSTGDKIRSFKSEEERYSWLKRIGYFSGIHWIVYDLSRFPYKMASRVLYLDEE